jgi:hypothetical protein
VSPGTSVTVTDESNYATAGEGTVPLIIIGTHEYKTLPSGSGVAEGTLPENANKLYPITSQRELLQTFGNPIFYTKNGTSVHGYELNEYGLHAAYQYLGIANRAFVIRADVDYAQLMPKATAPRADAAHGTNWLDTQNNTWGFYEWTGSEWAERDLIVIESTSDLDTEADPELVGSPAPLSSVGVAGDLAITVTGSKKVLFQKLLVGGEDTIGAWFVVGGETWTTTKTNGEVIPSLIYKTYRPETATVGDILILETPDVVTSLSAAATWLLKTFSVTTGTWLETLTPIYSVAKQSSLSTVTGSVYLSHEATTAVFEFKKYNGTAWVALGEEAGSVEPTSDPEEGTLWYNPTDLRVSIKANNAGTWVPYRQHPDFGNTDVNGVLLQGSAPTTQSTGAPLVNGDLWIDTTDLESFPKMYRYASGAWKVIDTANNIDPVNGIAFGELSTTSALQFENNMKLFDLSASTNDVKQYIGGVWTNVSGFQTDGVPFFGRKAQRQMIVKALAATITSNEDIRAETVYFNLLAAPGYIEMIDEMVTLNTDMKEVAFIVGDTPARLKPTGSAIATFASTELSGSVGNTEGGIATFNPYVGVYYPWGLSTNVDGNEIMVPPSTVALRSIAYSDSISYPWLAPAGFTRGLVTNASSVGYLDEAGEFKSAMLNQGQRDLLYQNRINPIAYMPNRGLVVWGQKTRHNLDTALDRINVARLINYLRYNLDNLSKPFLFEPNDQQTRDSVRTVFERFLGDLVGLRGLYDYVVVCDESNNTPERIDRNELWVDIAIQPVKAIEFIYIPVRIVATGDDLGALFQ